MSKTVLSMQLDIEIEQTQEFPPFTARVSLSGRDKDGMLWKRGFTAAGTTALNAISVVSRNKNLPTVIAAIAGSMSAEAGKLFDGTVPVDPSRMTTTFDKSRVAFYEKLDIDLRGLKHGKLRSFVAENGLPVSFTNFQKVDEIVPLIINAVKVKEASDEENK